MKVLDRIITLLLLVILAPIALVVVATLIVNWDRLPIVGVTIAGYAVQAVELGLLCMRLALAIGVAAAVALGIRYGLRWWHNYNQPRDGSHHLRTYKVLDPATGQKVSILVNPDLMVTPALAIGGHGVRELGALPAELYASHAQQRAVVASWQARTPGDEAIMSNNGSTYRMGGLGGSGKPAVEHPERLALPEPRIVGDEPAPAAAAEPMLLGDALRSSNPDQFILGHNPEAGTTAIWQPREHLNLGVFGVSGTGKTKSTGFQTMLLAARHGYHVVVLDPKGGTDFGPFAEYVEWQPTDSYTFADQLQAIYQVHAQRHQIMRDRQVGEWRALGPHAGPEVVVVFEEFGTIREEIAMEKGGTRKLDGIDHTVEMMFRLARMTGFHFVIIDQAPQKLHPVVRGGCKLRLAYHLDDSSASVLKEYEATELPPVGAFMVRRRQYQSWNCDAHLPQLLQRLPPFQHQRLLPPVDAERSSQGSSQPVHGAVHGQFMGSSPEVAPPPPTPVNTPMNTAPETVEGWYEWTLDNYLPAHPELLQLDARGRGMGVSALAAAMAAVNGKDPDAMKGTASEVAKRLRGDVGFMGGGGVAYGVNETGGKKEKA